MNVMVAIVWSEEPDWAAHRFPLYPITAAISEATRAGLYERARGRAKAFLDVRMFVGGFASLLVTQLAR